MMKGEELTADKSAFPIPHFLLITGGCKNGKSSYAQEVACKLAKKAGSAPLYFATMIPHDSEDHERIKKHRDDRKNLGFETIEIAGNFSQIVENLQLGRVILFDSLTALLANDLFEGRTDFSIQKIQEDAPKILDKIKKTLERLIQKSDSVIFVSDSIFCDIKYDEITELYRRNLAKIEQFLAEKCDGVVEMKNGRAEIKNSEENAEKSSCGLKLVVGGAYQGKTAFAREKFALSDEDIFVCSEDSEPDFSKPCLSHYENYIAYCLKKKISPKTDFSDCVAGDQDKVIICDDIFCGVVPVDAFQRKLREETGLALQKIAGKAELYRVFCGKGQKI